MYEHIQMLSKFWYHKTMSNRYEILINYPAAKMDLY